MSTEIQRQILEQLRATYNIRRVVDRPGVGLIVHVTDPEIASVVINPSGITTAIPRGSGR